MPVTTKRVKVAAFLEKGTKARVDEEINRLAMPMSGFINMLIANYFKEQDAINVVRVAEMLKALQGQQKAGTEAETEKNVFLY